MYRSLTTVPHSNRVTITCPPSGWSSNSGSIPLGRGLRRPVPDSAWFSTPISAGLLVDPGLVAAVGRREVRTGRVLDLAALAAHITRVPAVPYVVVSGREALC